MVFPPSTNMVSHSCVHDQRTCVWGTYNTLLWWEWEARHALLVSLVTLTAVADHWSATHLLTGPWSERHTAADPQQILGLHLYLWFDLSFPHIHLCLILNLALHLLFVISQWRQKGKSGHWIGIFQPCSYCAAAITGFERLPHKRCRPRNAT